MISQDQTDKWTVNPDLLFCKIQKLKQQRDLAIYIANKLMIFGINAGCWIEALQILEKEVQNER